MADIGGGTPFPVRNDWLDVQSKIFRLWERRWVVLEQNKVSFHRVSLRTGCTVTHPAVRRRLPHLRLYCPLNPARVFTSTPYFPLPGAPLQLTR